jgi:hypothetical protein
MACAAPSPGSHAASHQGEQPSGIRTHMGSEQERARGDGLIRQRMRTFARVSTDQPSVPLPQRCTGRPIPSPGRRDKLRVWVSGHAERLDKAANPAGRTSSSQWPQTVEWLRQTGDSPGRQGGCQPCGSCPTRAHSQRRATCRKAEQGRNGLLPAARYPVQVTRGHLRRPPAACPGHSAGPARPAAQQDRAEGPMLLSRPAGRPAPMPSTRGRHRTQATTPGFPSQCHPRASVPHGRRAARMQVAPIRARINLRDRQASPESASSTISWT